MTSRYKCLFPRQVQLRSSGADSDRESDLTHNPPRSDLCPPHHSSCRQVPSARFSYRPCLREAEPAADTPYECSCRCAPRPPAPSLPRPVHHASGPHEESPHCHPVPSCIESSIYVLCLRAEILRPILYRLLPEYCHHTQRRERAPECCICQQSVPQQRSAFSYPLIRLCPSHAVLLRRSVQM